MNPDVSSEEEEGSSLSDASSDASSVASVSSLAASEELAVHSDGPDDGTDGLRGRRSFLPIFPDKSVNLLTASSNSGKTHLMIEIVKNRDVFFGPDSVKSILYVNCNLQNKDSELDNPFSELDDDLPPLTVVNLADVDNVRDVSGSKQLVILDDVTYVNETINHYVTYCANHMDLIVFVLTQGCISEKLFHLVYKVHNIVMLLKNSSSVNLGQYLTGRFFLSKEKKAYLKQILSEAETGQHSVVLKLNAVSSSPAVYKKIFAFGNIEQLFADDDNRYCIVYPEIGEREHFAAMDIPGSVDPDTFLLVQAKHVRRQEKEASTGQVKCTKAQKWDEMNREISDEIRSSFEMKRWKDVFIIFKEILKADDFCISHDYRTLIIKSKKNLRVSLIDFLAVVTRRSYTFESLDKLVPYVPFVKVLIKNNIPSTFLKNQMLTQLAKSPAKVKRASAVAKNEAFKKAAKRRLLL